MKELEDYRIYMLNKKKHMSDVSVNNIVGTIKEFLSIMQIETLDQLKQLKKTDIQIYIYTIKQKNADSTNQVKMARVRMFFNYLFDYDLIEKNITKGQSIECGKTETIEFSHSDGVKVLNQANTERDYVILNTLLGTGIRISSLISLECKNIEDERIYIHAKGDKYAWIYCVKKVTDALKTYIEHTKEERGNSKYVFFSNQTSYGFLSKDAVNNVIKKCAERSGIENWEKFSSHKFRHIYATYALNDKEIPLDVVSTNLAHSSIETTRRYAKTQEQRVKSYFSGMNEKTALGRKEFDFSKEDE